MRELHLNENRAHGTADFPVAYYYVTPSFSRYVMEQHWHLQYEIIHIIEGQFELKVSNEVFALQAGEYAFLHEGTLHGGQPNNCIYECAVFDMNFIRARNYRSDSFPRSLMQGKNRIRTHFSKELLEKDPVLQEGLEAFFQCLQTENPFYEMQVQGHLFLLLAHIASHDYYEEILEPSPDYEVIEPIKKALEMIQTQYADNLTLEDLAKAAGLSSKYFCHIFQKLMGRTPIDYLNNFRIERAACLIEENKLPLMHICYDCGFNDYSYFIRVFKKYQKITPNQYKKVLS